MGTGEDKRLIQGSRNVFMNIHVTKKDKRKLDSRLLQQKENTQKRRKVQKGGFQKNNKFGAIKKETSVRSIYIYTN